MIWQAFFNDIRGGFTGRLEPEEVEGTEAIGAAMKGEPLAFAAYAMATAWHETAGTMQPISEIGGPRYFFSRYDPQGPRSDIARALGNTQAGDGARFHGRGYVQLTGRRNYAKASEALGVDLLDHPERAKEPGIAARIMREGMVEGWFTGKALRHYLPTAGVAAQDSFRQARRIINGLDRATDVATYAMAYQRALVKGKW